LRHHEASWTEHDVAIAVVSFEADRVARAYLQDTQLPWPVLLDRERSLYRAYGMDRAPLRAIWSPSTLLEYARLLRRGRKMSKPTDDTRQRGGDVLIDPSGIVRTHHVGKGPADRPSVASLLAQIR
jgi:hypothetical protein